MQAHWPSWGRYPPARQNALRLHDRFAPVPEVGGNVLPRGNGRSYGDVCLNDGGTLLDARGLDRYIAFNAETGVLRCESGLLLGDILEHFVARGWFLPVVPGTRFVTVGGAIANDIHGKNHHVAGSFGCHVRAFELLRSDGSRKICSRDANTDWFAATVGGLGLTGLITWAELKLQRVPGAWIDTEEVRFNQLRAFFELSAAAAADFDHTVAWIDCAARGNSVGRGVFSCGNPTAGIATSREPDPRRLHVPFTPPLSLVNRASLRAFNALHFARAPKAPLRRTRHYRQWLFPLDGIGDWNRLYGPRGFLQYQCVLPPDVAHDGIRVLLDRIAASGQGSFLAVLKQFGTVASPGLLSFPREGTTLALDFAMRGPTTFALLDDLDAVVAAAGGAVYPAKDARMSGKRFRTYFPAWERFARYVDPIFSSGFWRRVMQ